MQTWHGAANRKEFRHEKRTTLYWDFLESSSAVLSNMHATFANFSEYNDLIIVGGAFGR
jgi:hypothetical protein